MLETPSMKHEGLHYFQCLLEKEQATTKKPCGYEIISRTWGMTGELV
jgi:hypothetical protein